MWVGIGVWGEGGRGSNQRAWVVRGVVCVGARWGVQEMDGVARKEKERKILEQLERVTYRNERDQSCSCGSSDDPSLGAGRERA